METETKTKWKNDELKTDSVGKIICPMCGKGRLNQGPRGGAAVNCKCDECGTTYWYGGPFGLEKL